MRHKQGFTLVEVMVSLGLMTIGSMAIIGMQQQTVRANVHAREMTTASQIAQNVLERLKLQAVGWTQVSDAPANDLALAPSLLPITTSTPGNFITLTPVPIAGATPARILSNAFSYTGVDMDLTGASADQLAQVRYCASYRLTWIYGNFRAMRADVRVWWTNESPSHSIIADFAGCADDSIALNPGGAQYNNYHVVYLSTVIRPTSG
jgi:type IV pilus modification protein PilV